jgi:hyperosmotically inducible protein
MRTPQVLTVALAAVIAAGCSRAEADRGAREAAVEVRKAADVAGDRLSDGWLTTKIQAQYFADRDIKARYLDVATRDGAVTVSGFVDNLAARDRAIQIARNTDGVHSVVDQLKIGVSPAKEAFAGTPGAVATGGATNEYDAKIAATARESTLGPATDDALTASVQARFFLDPVIKTRDIEVTAQSGVVTLRGSIATEQERAQALLIARHTNGVGRVEDSLTVDAALR